MAAPQPAPASGQVRLAELLAALSLATDLADGFPPETALKTCLIAVSVGRELGLTGQPLSDVYYAALLRYLGCTSTAHESTLVFGGSDVSLRGAFAGIDFEQPREIVRAFRQLGRGGHRRPVRALAGLLAQGLADRDAMWRGLTAECEAQSRLARRLGLGEEVAVGLEHSYSLWNGKGFPRGLAGERIPRPARISYFSHVVEQHLRRGGDRRTVLMKVHGWAGGQVDPEVVEAIWRDLGVRSTTLVAFDFSSLVVLEHLRRRLERSARGEPAETPEIRGVFIFNGGLFTDGHSHPWFTTPVLRRLPRRMQVGLPFSLFKVMTAALWSKGYRVTNGEVRELYNALNRHDGLFYVARAAGFVEDHKAQGDRLDFGRLFKAYRGQFPFLVGGSEEDPFEHRQVDLARARLGGLGLQVEHLPGGHVTTFEQPEALASLIAKFERTGRRLDNASAIARAR